jgi:hypothetical protein
VPGFLLPAEQSEQGVSICSVAVFDSNLTAFGQVPDLSKRIRLLIGFCVIEPALVSEISARYLVRSAGMTIAFEDETFCRAESASELSLVPGFVKLVENAVVERGNAVIIEF